MSDYKSIESEYRSLNKWTESQIKDLVLIKEKMKVFKKNMITLKEDISKIKEIPNGHFGFLNNILKNFVNNMNENLFKFDDLIISPLDNFLYSFKFATSKNINLLKTIESDLTEEKQKLKNKRDIYFNYNLEENKEKNKHFFFKNLIGGNNDDLTKKKEINLFNIAVEDNYNQLYQYELDKMNEIIDENNTKYNNIYNEINAINASYKITVKESLVKFAKNINLISLYFNSLSEDILKKIDSIKVLNNEEISQNVIKISKAKNEPRFPKEIKEKKEKKIMTTKDEKKNLFNFFSKKKNQEESHINQVNNISNIINDADTANSKDKNDENKLLIDSICKKIVTTEEIKNKEINEVFNILNLNNEDEVYSIQFLNNIILYYNNRVISFKNEKNFFHLSNILNHLSIKHKVNNLILSAIIEISQKIKLENSYLYKIIRKKNEFLGTKTFWIQLIENNLKHEVDVYTDNILENKAEEKNNNINNNNNSIKDDENEEFEKNFLHKKINNYRKLYKNQKKDVIKFTKKKIIFILSKTIGQMCDFQVHENIISEILRDFDDAFKFDYNIKYYFKMKMIVIKNMKLKNQKKYYSKKDEILNNKLILISNISKYFPSKNYTIFFKLNKNLYPKLRKKIFLNLFSDFNLPISSHIRLWYEILEIREIKKKFDYQKIKKQKIQSDAKTITLIEKDVNRTFFIKDNKSHFEKLKNILVMFSISFPKIGYCQGMNCVAAFLYQLLNLKEDETFYFLCGLLLKTKYHEIFEDDFETLTLFFKIFEKILKINRPEIYYKFIDNNIVTSSYISPLFITLFTDCALTFNENSPPKFIFFILEKFILEGWSALFNCGFTLLESTYEKIMLLEKDSLTSFVINISSVIAKDDDFEKTANIFNKNSYFIDEFFVEKLIELTKMEKNNNYLDEEFI